MEEKCFRFPTYHIMIKEFFTHIMKVFLLEKDGVWEILQNTKILIRNDLEGT